MANKYYFSFLGATIPILRKRIKNPSEQHLLRVAYERISMMEGTFQLYYVKGLAVPLTKVDMEISLFLSKLTKMFNRTVGKEDADELWIYYGDESKWRNQPRIEDLLSNLG